MTYAVPENYELDKVVLQDLDATSDTAKHEAGYTVTAQDGSRFQYIKADTADVAPKTAAPTVWQSSTSFDGYVVTFDVSDNPDGHAGAACAKFGDNEYGWIQISGTVPDALLSTNVSAGDALVPQDGEYDTTTGTTAASTVAAVAVALEDDSGGAGDIKLLNG